MFRISLSALKLSLVLSLRGAAGLLTAAPVPQEAGKPLPYFPTQVGTKLVFRGEDDGDEYVYEVTGAGSKDGVVTVALNIINPKLLGKNKVMTETVLVSDGGVSRSEVGGEKLTPPLCLLKLPYKSGNEWKTNFETQTAKSKGTAKAGEIEEVRVPAGTFKAIPVTYEHVVNDIPRTMTWWYAAGVGPVKHTYTLNKKQKVDVLVSHSVPKK